MDYNGLSIVSPQYYPDDEEWNDFFNLWFQGYDLNTDITEHFHYLISLMVIVLSLILICSFPRLI